ncbi:hypothetical protein Dimus_019697, partial [Dionaea muscipula]
QTLSGAWRSLFLPRHQVQLWLAMQGWSQEASRGGHPPTKKKKNKWRTRGWLYDMGIIAVNNGVLSQGSVETTDHLPFSCEFSQAVLKRVMHHVKLRVTKGKTPLAQARRRCLAAVVYFIW